jgi:hypothetical protein
MGEKDHLVNPFFRKVYVGRKRVHLVGRSLWEKSRWMREGGF